MKTKGFTLIEVIAYMAIISIIAMIGIPSYKTIKDAKFNVDIINLINDIRYVKDLTYVYGKEYKITFCEEGYKIIDNNEIIKEYKFDKGNHLKNYNLNIGSKKVNYMSYTLNGNAVSSGTLIMSNNNESIQRKITIVPVTGRVLLIEN